MTEQEIRSRYQYAAVLEVRDYECDIQGIVNNANYLHYAEHTRHLFLHHVGLSFARMHAAGEDPVVARMHLQYKAPLRPDDRFLSCISMSKEGARYVFHQDFYRLDDLRLSFRADTELVVLVGGRVGASKDIDNVIEKLTVNG